jgi:RelA/SpoT family (p)ppGpp synthetase
MLQAKHKKKLDDLLAVCHKNLAKVNDDLITRAFEMSVEAHKHDLRSSGEPYFGHPFEVAMVVAKEIALDDVSVVSALLHDVVEDTDIDIEVIRKEFGDAIAEIVDGATKISNIFDSHEITQAENYRKLLLSMVNDIRVMIIKFADRLHNMRTLEYLPPEKQQRIAKETLDIYAPFAHRFGLAKIKWELEDLAFKHLHRKEYEEIAHGLNSKRREREHYIRKFIVPVETRLRQSNVKFEIEGRPKHLYSIYNKMLKRSKPLEEIYDMFAVRIILLTPDNNECFTVYGIISEIYKPIPERFKNYISIPKKNGYQSLHTTVVGPEGKMVEVQIRTRQMHEIAERGVAAHWYYKENGSQAPLDKELENWINWVREMFDQKHADENVSPRELIESFKLNLYQDEIYVFTPKGDLKILPKGATAIDFAFEIHSDVGFHTIGAKVNGRIVPLNTILRSGDQVEVITSKKQKPNFDWEKFAITHKAKSHIRRYIKEEERMLIEAGKEIWEKKAKKAKLHINDDDLTKFVHTKRYDNLQLFYLAIKNEEIDADVVINELTDTKQKSDGDVKPEETTSMFNKFVDTARNLTTGISIFGTKGDMLYTYAKCCNPIPGDDIVGYVTTGEGIKIHRRNCRNVQSMLSNAEQRIVRVSWPESGAGDFIAGIKISGNDRNGLLNDVTNAISNFNNTSIRGVTINTKDTFFDGQFILYVKDIAHLNGVIDRLKRIKNITKVERFDE